MPLIPLILVFFSTFPDIMKNDTPKAPMITVTLATVIVYYIVLVLLLVIQVD